MNELKARVVESVATYQRLPGRVGPAKIGSAMPAYLYEAGDYGPAVREERINPDTKRKYETTVTEIREGATGQELSDADLITNAVSELPEEARKLIWMHAVIKLNIGAKKGNRRTFQAQAQEMGLKRQELWRRMDKAFQQLAVVLRKGDGCMQPDTVALGPENADNDAMLGHDTFWRGFDTLEAAAASPIDFTRFIKSA